MTTVGPARTKVGIILALTMATAGMMLVVPWVAPSSAGVLDSSEAVASVNTAAVGDLVDVSGMGWAPLGGVATVQICGQDAQLLSSDCDEANTYSAAIRAGGLFAAALYVRIPPSPCPCVFYVTSVSGQSNRIPLRILGAPYKPITPLNPASTPLRLRASLDVPLSVSSWFGGPKHLNIKIKITNLTDVALPQSVVSVKVGRDPISASTVAGKVLALLPPHTTRTMQISFTIPAVTYGHYAVYAQVATEQGSAGVSLRTSSWPWAWAVLVTELFLVATTSSLRRRRERRQLRVRPHPAADPLDDVAQTRISEPV